MADASFSEIISSLTGAMGGLKNTFKDMQGQLRAFASELRGLSGNSGDNRGAPTPASPSSSPALPRFASYQDRQGFGAIMAAGLPGFVNAGFKAASAVGFALPTTQEAVDVQSIASRMMFYGGGVGYSTPGVVGGAYQRGSTLRANAYNGMLNASYMGTALGPMDAPMAINAATANGLLPGLPNFGAGAGYRGIMGGAALASNLTPGLGLAGGVNVMADLQNPQKINMARMFGLQYRNSDNSRAVDLPDIINQLFTILSKSAPVTKENIAISAMPGNALDSILNQYFGMDPQLRGVIIAGLIQKASGGGFSKAELIGTGAMTKGVLSTGNRASSEQNLIQRYASSTVKDLIGANNVLTNVYGTLANTSSTSVGGKAISAIQKFTVAMDTLAGARNGAGQLAMDALWTLSDTAGGMVANFLGPGSLKGMMGGLGTQLLTAYGAYKGANAAGLSSSTPISPFSLTGQSGVPTTNAGQTFTGAITINVSGGTDQYNIASAITQALSQAV